MTKTKKKTKEIKNWVLGCLAAVAAITLLLVPAGKYWKTQYDEYKAEKDNPVIEAPVEDETTNDGVGSVEDETKTEINFVGAFDGFIVG